MHFSKLAPLRVWRHPHPPSLNHPTRPTIRPDTKITNCYNLAKTFRTFLMVANRGYKGAAKIEQKEKKQLGLKNRLFCLWKSFYLVLKEKWDVGLRGNVYIVADAIVNLIFLVNNRLCNSRKAAPTWKFIRISSAFHWCKLANFILARKVRLYACLNLMTRFSCSENKF